MAAMNHIEPYLRSVFGFLGVKDVTFINASGTARRDSAWTATTILQPASIPFARNFRRRKP
jgi:FMN-dependent NADH-azoreductase